MKPKRTHFLLALFALLSLQMLTAQELTSAQVEALKSDDVSLFQKEFPKETFDQCFNIKESSYNLLAIAIKMDTPNLFEFLLNSTIDLNKMCDNKTPLMFAAKYGKYDFAKKLVNKGADKTITNSKGYTARDYAERENFSAIVELLK